MSFKRDNKNDSFFFAYDYPYGRLTEYGHLPDFDVRGACRKVKELGRALTEEELKHCGKKETYNV